MAKIFGWEIPKVRVNLGKNVRDAEKTIRQLTELIGVNDLADETVCNNLAQQLANSNITGYQLRKLQQIVARAVVMRE